MRHYCYMYRDERNSLSSEAYKRHELEAGHAEERSSEACNRHELEAGRAEERPSDSHPRHG